MEGRPPLKGKELRRVKSLFGTIGRACEAAGLPEKYGLNDFFKECNIRSVLGGVENANTAEACMYALDQYAVYLKGRKILSEEYYFPKIKFYVPTKPFKLNPLASFKPFMHIKTKIMQFVCLLAGDMRMRTTHLVNFKTTDFAREKLVLKGRKPMVWSKNVIAFLKDNPALVNGKRYLLSIDGRKMSAKTLTRRFQDALVAKYKGNVTLQAIASAKMVFDYEKGFAEAKKAKQVVPEPVQMDFLEQEESERRKLSS